MEATPGRGDEEFNEISGSHIHGFSHPSQNKPTLFTFASATVHFLHSQGFQTSNKMVPERHIKPHLRTLNVLIYVAFL